MAISFLFDNIVNVLQELQHDEGAAHLESEITNQFHKLIGSLKPEDRNTTLSALIRIFDQIIQYPKLIMRIIKSN